ncbi:unnamed protein product [Ectocarpus sp. CCAP 1310/34]|nr:unnamed protein product [Ectocarpus sp. CCAP 1310/34]
MARHEGVHAARRHILAMDHVDFSSIPNVGVNGHRLWLASALWASACFNRSATKANLGCMSPLEAFFGRKSPLTVVIFFHEGMMRVKRATKADVQSARCFYLHGANNHSTSTAVVLHADSGRRALTNNVVWVNHRAGAPAPVPGIWGGSSVTVAPSPAVAVPAADAAPPPPPPARRYTYTPPAPATTAPPPPASPPIFTGSSAPSPISDASSSAPPSTAATPPRSPPGLPPPPPQPTSAVTPAPRTRRFRNEPSRRWDERTRGFTAARAAMECDEYGWPTKFKARLVAWGHMQRASIDFGELFAPTVSVSSVRLLAALACEQNLDLCHFDILQAFVQSELDEDVFMHLPQGCGRSSGLIAKLCESLYGLKQASRRWYAHLTRCLLLLGFLQCLADTCVFRLMEKGHVIIIIVVHVDDIFAVGQKERCDKFGRDLNEMVPVKNRVEVMVHWKAALGILGYERRTSWMGITFERGVLTEMSMQVFVDDDYASKAADRRSVSGGLVMCALGGVTWFSRTQKCVILTTTEAEYMAIADVLKELLFLRQGAIQIAHNPITNSNSKHIDVRHHFIRELVERKEISIALVPTHFQHADFLTKAISKESLALHRDFVMNLQ